MKLTVGINYGYGKTYNKDGSKGGSLNFRLQEYEAMGSVGQRR